VGGRGREREIDIYEGKRDLKKGRERKMRKMKERMTKVEKEKKNGTKENLCIEKAC
jgi:hypothetical protein